MLIDSHAHIQVKNSPRNRGGDRAGAEAGVATIIAGGGRDMSQQRSGGTGGKFEMIRDRRHASA
jgi:hypothetical protein